MTKENREYPRWVHNKDGRSAYLENAEAEKALKGKGWQDLPYHEERDGDVVETKPAAKPVPFADDKKAELDQKVAHDLAKEGVLGDDLEGSGYVDQEDAPDDEDGKPKRGRPRKEV